MRTRLPRLVAVTIFVASLACARASEPLPPAEEVLLVVNRDDAALQVISIDAPTSSTSIPLGGIAPTPTGVSARDGWALVPLGAEDAVQIIDLRALSATLLIPLPTGSGATGSALVDDSIGYVANPNLNSVTRVNYLTGDTASVAVGVYPQSLIFTRGKLFVLNGNLVNNVPAGPSWISIIDPLTNRLATGIDSILMPGPGNAAFGAVAQDGVLYVMNRGRVDGTTPARLTLVDPVGRVELANFGGLGNAPGEMAVNSAADLLYISSTSEGLMQFDVVDRKVLRGAGNGVTIPDNTSVAVDPHGLVYALEAGSCSGGAAGKVHILRANLTETRTVAAGRCASGSLITAIPPVQ